MCKRLFLRAGLCVALQLVSQLITAPYTFAQGVAAQENHGGWPVWGGDTGGTRFSPLRDINKDNVGQLQVAWEYHTGDSSDLKPAMPPSSFLATPVLRDNTLYFCSGYSRAFAVDAETGQERWVYDSKPIKGGKWTSKCRGVALWEDSTVTADNNVRDDARNDSHQPCQARVFMGTFDARLVAIDAATGKACQDFGDHGVIDLRQGLGKVNDFEMAMTSPPLVINDLVIQGAMVADNQRADSPSGVIRAWDARTGALRWAFDPVPPGTPSARSLGAPAGQIYHSGTPNSWGISSADPARNLVFVPFGSAGLDFIGGQRRRDGFDLAYYANSVVALNASTGEVVWHFQVVHQDLWDYDIAAQPVLLDIKKDGKTIPAVVQATKMGHLFILNRETGESLYPVEERPVPQSKIPGEYTSPTQPFPTFPQPLHPHGLTADDAWGLTFYDRGACRKKILEADNEGMFTPPALNKHTIEFPGVAGGQNWGGLAYDRNHNLLIMPQNYMATYNELLRREEVPKVHSFDEDYSPNLGTPYVVKHEMLLSPFGVPCIAPPWGTLLAVSLDTGKISWQVPFGTARDMVSALSWFPYFPDMGLPSAGGPVVTDTGLVFIGAALDDYIRAYDAVSGEELWRFRLAAGAQATPMTYRGARSGRQFVVIAAGGHSTMRTKVGDALMAFSLPETANSTHK
jgi:quinoprotein glucose dehydrogenase